MTIWLCLNGKVTKAAKLDQQLLVYYPVDFPTLIGGLKDRGKKEEKEKKKEDRLDNRRRDYCNSSSPLDMVPLP
jgi:hypothetical protein